MDPATLLIAATATQAVGSVASGFQQGAALDQQAQAADYNAQTATIQADQARAAGTENELTKRRSNAQFAGQQRAALGESGFVPNSGSALDVQDQSNRNMELDALQERYQGLLQGGAYDQQAQMQRYTADTLRDSADNARTSGFISAASGILMGGARSKMMQARSQSWDYGLYGAQAYPVLSK